MSIFFAEQESKKGTYCVIQAIRNEMIARRALKYLSRARPASVVKPVVPTLALTVRHFSDGPASIVDRGFWGSLVPKPLRKENRQSLKNYGKRWNPATFFIVIFLLIGSMSIQMITLRNSFDRYMRTSQVRIGLLREVVERIQNGEKVDVEKLLGTGEPEKEADWEEGENCTRERQIGVIRDPSQLIIFCSTARL